MDQTKKEIALKLLHDLDKNPYVVNQGKTRNFEDFDNERLRIIIKVQELLNGFFEGTLALENFKTDNDSLNKRNPLWGFRGFNGLMFFNTLYKSSINKKDLSIVLRDVLRLPSDIKDAKNKIDKLLEYIKSNGVEQNKRKSPRPKSTLFFLSYFWQIQNPQKYPIFYNSLEQVFLELGFLQPNENLSAFYEEFFNLNYDLMDLFKKENKKVNLWYVEHVFWKYFIESRDIEEKQISETKEQKRELKIESDMNFIPLVIADLIELSLNESDPSNFEKKTGALFTILGFEAHVAGQGRGRIVDVIARANTSQPYILLIDCKARSNKDFKFNAGEERIVIEYIKNFSHDFPRDRKLETHYLIVSSGFRDSDDSVRRKIKGETGIDISFITADALLFLVSKKLQTWNLDLDLMREIFQREGLITKDMIQDVVGR